MSELVDEIIADAEAQTAPGTDIAEAERPCDSTITAIYPVRYGYANLFDDVIAPSEPPPISQLLSADSIAAGDGYVARLLRPGWIYIREEAGGSAMQIFRYDRESPDGTEVVERFRKYLFTNRIDASGGLELDRSSGRDFYPFVFVNKGVSEVSILYTEHELAGEIVDKINGNAAFRAQTMQRINLVAGGRDAVEASSENLGRLVEDYRARRDRVLSEADGVALDIMMTEGSFRIDPDLVAQQISNTECYGDTSMIVALNDPVGRQIEIAQTHAKLAVWEQDVAALNLYPYMIGQFVEAARTSANEDITDAVTDNINLAAHQEYWCEMDEQFQNFAQRRAEIAALYRAFMYPGAHTDRVGSLDQYFRYFFAYDTPTEPELVKLLTVAGPIFDGLMASEQGQQMLAELADHAHGAEAYKPIYEQQNVLGAFTRGLIALTTQAQANVDWEASTARAMDRAMNGLGAFWGRAIADSQFAGQITQRAGYRMSAAALQNIVDQVIPKVLDVFGLAITDGTVRYSSEDIGRMVGRAMQMNVERGGYAGIDYLERAAERMENGQKVFDWGRRQSSGRLARLWRMAEVDVTRPSGARYAFSVDAGTGKPVGIIVDRGFAGLSAFFNVMTIASLAHQSQFSRANPLQRGSMLHDALTFGSAISALTVDMMTVGRAGFELAGYASTRVLPAAAAARLAPGMTARASGLARLIGGTLGTRLIAVANFAMAITSTMNAIGEFRQGNTTAGVGHAMMALGAGVLFFTAAASLGGGAAVSGATVVGLPVALVASILALICLGIGTVLVLLYSRNPFELLLFQCFWGKSRNYAFWKGDTRPAILDQITQAQSIAFGTERSAQMQISFRLEVQEFMNIFAMPQMELDIYGGSTSRMLFGNLFSDDRSYDIILRLPQFVIGQSEIVAGVYANGVPVPDTGLVSQSYDATLTSRFTDAVRTAIENGRYTHADGMMVLTLRVDFGQRANILWYYLPKPDVIVPMRMLTNRGELRVSGITAGMRNERPI